MSSASEQGLITSNDLKMLQSVLSDAGFGVDMLEEDERCFNDAARKIIQLFQDGMTDPADLKEEMLFLFGIQKRERVTFRKPLPRYAIQGLPILSK
ncbi:hypothetical protein [Rhizobium sp. RM]|uniref:hypothetical protein n=1 Tax=Rhizobium sp. RM TaxID=2748079 RepID=UPI00110EE9B3|nr:hypothetical protein [Rhizobium sp. RM]NWJ27629.1 hypothetical protein [Rhizobium sp. RM]TMV19924.1 hypothetical protein BJG94_10945 [Rhizobium sp. Td3]